jgi:hypothetical protein
LRMAQRSGGENDEGGEAVPCEVQNNPLLEAKRTEMNYEVEFAYNSTLRNDVVQPHSIRNRQCYK